MSTYKGSANSLSAVTERRAIHVGTCAAGRTATILTDDFGVRICREALVTER